MPYEQQNSHTDVITPGNGVCWANWSQWRHNGHGSVSNRQPHDCLLNRLFRRRSEKTLKLRVTGLWAGNSSGTSEFPARMTSNAENVSIWWRHIECYEMYLDILIRAVMMVRTEIIDHILPYDVEFRVRVKNNIPHKAMYLIKDIFINQVKHFCKMNPCFHRNQSWIDIDVQRSYRWANARKTYIWVSYIYLYLCFKTGLIKLAILVLNVMKWPVSNC